MLISTTFHFGLRILTILCETFIGLIPSSKPKKSSLFNYHHEICASGIFYNASN